MSPLRLENIDEEFPPALLFTGHGFGGRDRLFEALRECVPEGWARPTGLGGIFVLEAEGDMLELAERIYRDCPEHVARLVSVFAAVDSEVSLIKEAATSVARNHVGVDESFVFRIHKHGSEELGDDIQGVERDIGETIAAALRERRGVEPEVDLEKADVTISAELLGPITFLGVYRRAWEAQESEFDESAARPADGGNS